MYLYGKRQYFARRCLLTELFYSNRIPFAEHFIMFQMYYYINIIKNRIYNTVAANSTHAKHIIGISRLLLFVRCIYFLLFKLDTPMVCVARMYCVSKILFRFKVMSSFWIVYLHTAQHIHNVIHNKYIENFNKTNSCSVIALEHIVEAFKTLDTWNII